MTQIPETEIYIVYGEHLEWFSVPKAYVYFGPSMYVEKRDEEDEEEVAGITGSWQFTVRLAVRQCR